MGKYKEKAESGFPVRQDCFGTARTPLKINYCLREKRVDRARLIFEIDPFYPG